MSYSHLSSSLDALLQAFEQFKEENEKRLQDLEKGTEDPVIADKINRIEDFMNRTQEQMQQERVMAKRPALSSSMDHEKDKHTKAFFHYVRTGNDQELRSLERKALGAQSNESGGFLLPSSLVSEIYSSESGYCPMRDLATVVQTNHHQYELILSEGSEKASWGEDQIATQAKEGSQTPKFNRLTIPINMLFYLPIISRTLLADAYKNIESWFLEEMHKGLARGENTAFFTGDGNKKPKGILSHKYNKDGGKDIFQSINTGSGGAFPEKNPENCLIDALHLLKPEYLKNATWVLSRSALSSVRKMRTSDGHYLWQPPLSADLTQQTLLGYPLVLSDDMPSLEAGKDSVPIMFGDMKQAYIIADRAIEVQRDELTCKPNLQLLITKRVGGAVRNFEAMKWISCSK